MNVTTLYKVDQIVDFKGKPARISEINIKVKSNAVRFWKEQQITIRYSIETEKHAYGVDESEISPWTGEHVHIRIGSELY
jgi:hypothetical protein